MQYLPSDYPPVKCLPNLNMTLDSVEQLLSKWAEVAPDVDTTPLGVVQRVIRLGRLAEERLQREVARHGIRVWGDYEVLAALRRAGPYRHHSWRRAS